MPCHAIRKWTFSGLVGTFVDISITFLLLCASALAYFASAFLSLFGLDLPCSCNGFFRISSHYCLQSQLFDLPSQRISSVQCSVKSKFPFNSPLNCNLEEETNGKHESGGSEGEAASCISSGDLTKMKEKCFVMGAMNSPDFKERRFPRRRSRNNLRRRKKNCVDNRKLTWVSSCKSLWSDVETHQSACSPLSGLTEDISDKYKEDANFKDGKEGLLDIGSKRKISQGFELSESVDENEPIELSGHQGIDIDAKNTIRLLEQALEEEHAMRAVLYMELEKERSAAATAADEAMAMISRLQEEKALIEMESRQRQRIVEDRYAYDEEEMNILKEILVRREREIYFLEKEVEAYRQLIANENTDGGDTHGKEFTLYLSDDDSVVMMPQQQPQPPPQLQHKLTEEDDNKSSISEERIESTSPPSYEDKEREGLLIHDVHVIDDDQSCKQINIEEKNNKQVISSNSYRTKTAGNNPMIISSGLPPIGRTKSLRSSSSSDMRRKSMSSFDSERFRIGSEISWLREKLKCVQEGREKLNFNKSNREREKAQLQILENLTSQLREIRHLTEPGKAARRSSLPPLSSHVMSKKRRWRSGPLVQGSV